MRTKLSATLVAACALAVLVIGPAGAAASTVTFTDENGLSVAEGYVLNGASTNFKIYTLGGSGSCGKVQFSGELTANETDPATMAPLSGGGLGGCLVGPFVYKITNLETSGGVEFPADGTSAMSLELDVEVPYFSANCHFEGSVPFSWAVSEATQLDVYGTLHGTGWSGCYEMTISGSFSLERDEAGDPIRIVTQP